MIHSPLEQALYRRILDFVSAETGTRKHLREDTDIVTDLGVDGDDAVEFMLKFQKEFDVDLSNFQFDKYFGWEGFSLIPFIKSVSGKRQGHPITIFTLFDAATHHCWPKSSQ